MRVMLIEDDYSIRDALTQMLEDEAYEIVPVADGQAALAYLRQTDQLPDLILLDLAMPVMSGWEFRAVQQADPVFASIPVVVLSADRGVQQKAASIAADAFLAKPVLLDELLTMVARFAP